MLPVSSSNVLSMMIKIECKTCLRNISALNIYFWEIKKIDFQYFSVFVSWAIQTFLKIFRKIFKFQQQMHIFFRTFFCTQQCILVKYIEIMYDVECLRKVQGHLIEKFRFMTRNFNLILEFNVNLWTFNGWLHQLISDPHMYHGYWSSLKTQFSANSPNQHRKIIYRM